MWRVERVLADHLAHVVLLACHGERECVCVREKDREREGERERE